MTTPNQQAHWQKTVLHALGIVVLSVLLSSIAAGVLLRGDSAKLGEALGQDLPWLFAFGCLLSYGAQTGKRWMMVVGGIVTVIGVFGPALFIAAVALRAQNTHITDAERAPFKLTNRMACHPLLPLTFGPVPARLDVDPALQAKMESKISGATTAVWAWRDGETRAIVLLSFFRGGKDSAESFERFIDGLRQGIRTGDKLKIDHETRTVDAKPYRYELLGTAANGVAMSTACRSIDESSHRAATACIQTFAGSHEDLADLRASLVDQRCEP